MLKTGEWDRADLDSGFWRAFGEKFELSKDDDSIAPSEPSNKFHVVYVAND